MKRVLLAQRVGSASSFRVRMPCADDHCIGPHNGGQHGARTSCASQYSFGMNRARDDLTVELTQLSPADAGELLTLQRAAYATEAQIYGDPFLPTPTAKCCTRVSNSCICDNPSNQPPVSVWLQWLSGIGRRRIVRPSAPPC